MDLFIISSYCLTKANQNEERERVANLWIYVLYRFIYSLCFLIATSCNTQLFRQPRTLGFNGMASYLLHQIQGSRNVNIVKAKNSILLGRGGVGGLLGIWVSGRVQRQSRRNSSYHEFSKGAQKNCLDNVTFKLFVGYFLTFLM